MTVSYENYRRQALHQIDNLAKPPGSLGLLEKQAKQILLAWGTFHRELRPKHIIFAADNGVVQAGVVAQLADITYMQSCHMVQGTSAVTCFCRSQDIPYEVVDVGIDSDDAVGLDRKIARGTKNFAVEPAMSREQLVQAMATGRERVQAAAKEGINLLSFGEMGIGNTTTTAAVVAALLHAPAELVTGRGSGLTTAGLEKKIRVVTEALEKWQPDQHDPVDILSKVGGFDLCGLTGMFLGGAACGLPMLIDGVISGAAALCAVRMCETVREYLIPSHHTAEPAGVLIEQALDVHPLIDAHMALGEGTGAVCLFGPLDMATSLYYNGNTFDDSNIEAYVPLV